jgi:lipid A 3-O-deacylase
MARLNFVRGWMGKLFLAAIMVTAARAEEPVSFTPNVRYELDFTTGVFWKVGGGATPLSYTLLPQIITLKIPPISSRPFAGGTLVMRSRFSLLMEPIIQGPESYYLGLAAAGEIEWRDASQRFTAFFAAGGGFGWMDSKGYQVVGGQGQDFNLNWLVHVGVRYRPSEEWQISVGLYFQHISNKGMDKVNPGLNALGPTLGFSRLF